jgi:hypothetical protein
MRNFNMFASSAAGTALVMVGQIADQVARAREVPPVRYLTLLHVEFGENRIVGSVADARGRLDARSLRSRAAPPMIHDVAGEGETEVMTKVHAASVHESLDHPAQI